MSEEKEVIFMITNNRGTAVKNDIRLFGETDAEGNTKAKTFNLQVGIDGSESSRITVNTTLSLV